jgi:hypothetical protein
MTCRKFWLGLICSCRGKATLILTGNGAVLLEEESMQCCRQKMIQSTLTIHSQGIHLISDAYIFTFFIE